MKTSFIIIMIVLCTSLTFSTMAKISERAGFRMPDSVNEVTIRYKRIQNLIILPVVINDTILVNLVLDTGCRNLLLFGKRFTKLFNIHPNKHIEFSGLGSGKPISGKLSLGNSVSIGAVLGERIPVVVAPSQNLFGNFLNVDGIIGYDVFIKFEIELSALNQTITFRPAAIAELSDAYCKIPIRVVDSTPVVRSMIVFDNGSHHTLDLMIDTGSSLALLIKTKDSEAFEKDGSSHMLGRGLNGAIDGFEVNTRQLSLSGFEMVCSRAGITYSPWPNQGSIGMEILQQYNVVLNYCKGYIGIKRDVLATASFQHSLQKPFLY